MHQLLFISATIWPRYVVILQKAISLIISLSMSQINHFLQHLMTRMCTNFIINILIKSTFLNWCWFYCNIDWTINQGNLINTQFISWWTQNYPDKYSIMPEFLDIINYSKNLGQISPFSSIDMAIFKIVYFSLQLSQL